MTKTEREIYADFDSKYQAAKEELDKRFTDFNEFEDLYWGYLDNQKNPWKSSIFDPEAFEKVERVTSHLFASVPRGRVMPRDEKDDIVKAPLHDELFRYQWTKPQQAMHSKLQRIGRSFSIFGTAFGLLEWRYEKAKKVFNGEAKNVVVWDDPYFKDLYIYDCFPDPAATCVEDMEYFILNEYTTLKALKAANVGKRYKNLGELELKVKDKKKNDASSDSYRNRVDDIQGLDSGIVKDRLLIRRMFTRDRWVTIVPDYKIVIEDRENPYWHGELPVHVLTNYEYPNQLYGRGELDVIRKLQKGLNNVLNQRLDNVRMILNPVVKTVANARFAHTWKFRPGQKWVMDRLDEVDQFQIADVTGNTFLNTVGYFKESMAKALGQNDIVGKSARQEMNITATRDKLAAMEQNVRMKAKEAQVDAFIQRLVNQWIQLNQQFITNTRAVRILGGDNLKQIEETMVEIDPVTGQNYPKTEIVNGVEVEKIQKTQDGTFASIYVSPEDLIGSFDFIVETGSTSVVDPVDEFQNMVTAVGLLKQAEQSLAADGTKVNYRPILEKQLYELGIKNTDGVFETLPQQPQAPMDMGGGGGQPPMPEIPMPGGMGQQQPVI